MKFSTIVVSIVACLAAAIGIMALTHSAEASSIAGVAAFALADAALTRSKALPNGAAATTSDAIDLGHDASGSHVSDVEFLVTAPALNTTQMPNSKTMTYAVVHSDNADLSAPSVLYDGLIVQVGAGGAGAAAATARFRPPSTAKRYIGVRATGSASGDASGASFTVEALA